MKSPTWLAGSMAAAKRTRKPLAWATTRGSATANSFKVSRHTCEYEKRCAEVGARKPERELRTRDIVRIRLTALRVSTLGRTYPSKVVLFVARHRHHCAHDLARQARRVDRYYLLHQLERLKEKYSAPRTDAMVAPVLYSAQVVSGRLR